MSPDIPRVNREATISRNNSPSEPQKRAITCPLSGVGPMREKAAQTRKANAALRATSALRKDFGTDGYWVELAHGRHMRLPAWGTPITTSAIRKWLKKLGRSVEWYRDWQGEKDLADFTKRNPGWPLRALIGLLLEEVEVEESDCEAHPRVVGETPALPAQ